MAFDVLHARILTDLERVDAIVLSFLVRIVMDAAASDDGHITVVGNVEGVVDHIGEPRLRKDDRDVDLLTLRTFLDEDIDAGVVGFRGDLDIRGIAARKQFAVFTDVISARRNAVNVGERFQQVCVDGGKINSHGCS